MITIDTIEKKVILSNNNFGRLNFMPKKKKLSKYWLKVIPRGFTLLELLIVVAIMAILGSIIIGANISSSYQKARDSKRKQDLNKMVRILEDYYNDHGHYPPGNDPPDGKVAGAVWGQESSGFIQSLPADPLSPNQDYFYQTGPDIQSFYVLYARLENQNDDDIARVGCQEGCGPKHSVSGKRYFNYFVASTDIYLIAGIPNNGQDPGTYEGGGDGGGGGLTPTGGGGTPTNTPPWGSGPSPTLNLTPPAGEGSLCDHNQCCLDHICGAPMDQGGAWCMARQKCSYSFMYGWTCAGAAAEGCL